MKKIITILLLTTTVAVASIVVLFDPVTGRIGQVIPSADTLQYVGNSNALINPIFPTNALDKCWVTNGVITPKTQAQLDGEFQVISNGIILNGWIFRSNTVERASWYTQNTNEMGRILRAFALLTLDQINTLRKNDSLAIITTNTFLNAMSNAVINDPR